ncbi:MAG TPA: 16S rRNA (cytosine(1402)-N(4))-methyltransferase RsmH [Waddliaceae bacterium]
MDPTHTPVLLEAVLRSFEGVLLPVFVDGTVGAGGHSAAILDKHPEIQQFVGLDQDPTAVAISRRRLEPWSQKVTLIHENFANFDIHLKRSNIEGIDGMLLDLGVSSMQLKTPERGFSFSQEGPLDMRMDPTTSITAADIINTWSERDLALLFRDSGEEKQWRRAAKSVVKARQKGPIMTTSKLVEILLPVLKIKKKAIHPLTLVFQALRICVNQELVKLEQVLPKAINRLRKGGRLAVISFHSLEDRMVKNVFRYAASDKESTSGIGGVFLSKEPEVRLITKKPAIPTDLEVASNPRSRSAKLRVVEKL